MKRLRSLKFAIATVLAIGAVSGSAAQVSTTPDVEIQAISAGEQIPISDYSGSFEFSGHQIEFSNFSGVLGRSSDIAYIIVADGSAQKANEDATAGRVLMLPPYGGQADVQRFDAKRFLQSWPAEKQDELGSVHAALKDVAKDQRWLVFFGRYESTEFNLAAPGSAKQELARRSLVGGDVISDIRFSAAGDPAALEKMIVERFVSALSSGDADTVAMLMDPTPFGRSDLRGGADGARRLTAQRLVASQDWSNKLLNADVSGRDGVWNANSGQFETTIILKPLGDFAFIQSINTGA